MQKNVCSPSYRVYIKLMAWHLSFVFPDGFVVAAFFLRSLANVSVYSFALYYGIWTEIKSKTKKAHTERISITICSVLRLLYIRPLLYLLSFHISLSSKADSKSSAFWSKDKSVCKFTYCGHTKQLHRTSYNNNEIIEVKWPSTCCKKKSAVKKEYQISASAAPIIPSQMRYK